MDTALTDVLLNTMD